MWNARVDHLSMTAHARLLRSTLGFNGKTSAGLLLNQHGAPMNSLEMVVQVLGGRVRPATSHHIIVSTLERSRKHLLVTYDTPKDDWFLGISVGSPPAFGGSTSTASALVP